MLVDSHCHLNYKGLREEVKEVVERGRSAGVGRFLTINTKLAEFDEVHAIARRFDDVVCSVGVHPHEADSAAGLAPEAIVERTRHPEVVGIGETGLDFYYDNAPRDVQRTSFRSHIAAARATGLPLIVHTRDAETDTGAIMTEELEKGPYKAVIHCFSGSRGFMERMVDLGFYISLSGIVTFKKSTDLQDIARRIPADRLLVETDAPFLAPVPHRGKTCEPAYVADTARFVADLRGESETDLHRATGSNFFRLFDKASPPGAADAKSMAG